MAYSRLAQTSLGGPIPIPCALAFAAVSAPRYPLYYLRKKNDSNVIPYNQHLRDARPLSTSQYSRGYTCARQHRSITGSANLALGAEAHMPSAPQRQVRFGIETTRKNRHYPVATHTSTPPTRPDRTIHIIGTDEKSKFLAHALQASYSSVELLSSCGPDKYGNIVLHSNKTKTRKARPFKNHVLGAANRSHIRPCGPWSNSNDHITDLIVTENSIDVLKEIKDRVDHRTTICVAPQGLGLVEKAREEVFCGARSQPAFVLGHFARAYRYDRNAMAVRQMPRNLTNGFTYLTRFKDGGQVGCDSSREALSHSRKDDHRTRLMVRSLESSHHIQATELPFSNWLRLKLPAMVFSSVVDPICTILNCRYDQVLLNPCQKPDQQGISRRRSKVNKFAATASAKFAEKGGHQAPWP
jgi:hypothetical protein